MRRFLASGPQRRRTLAFASATHVWSDLLFALLVPLLLLMREDPELNLTYTQVGLLRSVHAGASAALQVPFGFLAERIGEFWLLLMGNIWVATGLLVLASAHAFPAMFWATLVGGLGGGTQHPLASSLVSRAYDDRGRSTAVGTVNFSGDLGKMAAPAAALLVAIPFGWRVTLRYVGLAGIAFMALSVFTRKGVTEGRPSREDAPAKADSGGAAKLGAFIDLSVVGVLDSSVKAAALTFLPFLMKDKGMSIQEVFGMLILLLGGGAVGKLVCGWLDERYGSVRLIWGTKGLSAALLLATLATPTLAMAPLMVALGIGLNGTSSVLYATVAKFVPVRLRARYYGFFYTTGEGGSALAPIAIGFIADLSNVRVTIVVLALLTAMILPMSLSLRKPLAREEPTTSKELQ